MQSKAAILWCHVFLNNHDNNSSILHGSITFCCDKQSLRKFYLLETVQTVKMDLDVGYRHICGGCLSTDRDLTSLGALDLEMRKIFRFIMYDYTETSLSDTLSDIDMLCWECQAHLRKFMRFKSRVHSAQQHIGVLALSRGQETIDHSYLSQSVSPLVAVIKADYDRIFVDYSSEDLTFALFGGGKSELPLEIDTHVLRVPSLDSPTDVNPSTMTHIVVTGNGNHMVFADEGKPPMIEMTISPIDQNKVETVILNSADMTKEELSTKIGFTTEIMTDEEMHEYREQLKEKVTYASAAYKCQLCIVGFYTQQEVENHFVNEHQPKPGHSTCPTCYVSVPDAKLVSHAHAHRTRYSCRVCGAREHGVRAMAAHVRGHHWSGQTQQPPKKKDKSKEGTVAPKPGDLRKLLSKTTIEGYKCLECDMFFKSSRARQNHVARFHREGLQCDVCKKKFVNRTTLATHLKLHEGPLPRSECPVCHKMVRVIQLKYHIQRHQTKSRYECADCNKVFSHLTTYQAHLKYSRAHATEDIFKYPCPMCNKGYPSKEQMQDHFNYQHLGKTSHKCPVCDKPIASRANVDKHMMRVHGEKKPKPRNHVCLQCGKTFTDKKALNQHEVIHSGARPLECDICHQTFKQKASLYTHRKRMHKVYPLKKVVEFMENKANVQ